MTNTHTLFTFNPNKQHFIPFQITLRIIKQLNQYSRDLAKNKVNPLIKHYNLMPVNYRALFARMRIQQKEVLESRK